MKNALTVSTFALALSLYSGNYAAAESIALNAVNKANDVIDAVVEAYGGSDALTGLKSVSISNVSETHAVGQSRNPGAPYDKDKARGTAYIDYDNRVFVTRSNGTGGGNQFDFGTTINGENSYNVNYRAGVATPLAEPDFNTASGPFIRVTSALLVKQLQERRHTSHWLGVEDVDGRPHDVITLVMEVGPGLSLYFDQETRMLSRSERILPPFGVVGYRFADHKTVKGIPFNSAFELTVNGANNLNRINSDIAVNKARKGITDIPKGFRVDSPLVPDAMSSNKIDEGVYLIGGGGAYSLFVEMEDYVFAAGATGGADTRIAELRKLVPEKPIRYALLTHHHNDHIPGASDFVDAGATLLTVADNKVVVREATGSEDAKLEFVDGKRTLSDDMRSIEIRNIGPTPHAQNLLVVYLPREGIVFEADHFSLPLNGTLPPPSNNSRAFASAVKSWDFDRLVGAHSPEMASKSDLLQTLTSEVSAR